MQSYLAIQSKAELSVIFSDSDCYRAPLAKLEDRGSWGGTGTWLGSSASWAGKTVSGRRTAGKSPEGTAPSGACSWWPGPASAGTASPRSFSDTAHSPRASPSVNHRSHQRQSESSASHFRSIRPNAFNFLSSLRRRLHQRTTFLSFPRVSARFPFSQLESISFTGFFLISLFVFFVCFFWGVLLNSNRFY